MPENLNSLYEYLEKEHISFDKTEFEFQIQSHPDYPSLLVIVDSLGFSIRRKKLLNEISK